MILLGVPKHTRLERNKVTDNYAKKGSNNFISETFCEISNSTIIKSQNNEVEQRKPNCQE